MKKCFPLFSLSAILILFSCKSDDDYTPILIETVADLVSTEQNQSIEIDFFLNDTNVPTQGTVSFSVPANGTIEINNNSTPDNPSDDLVVYTPNTDYFGEDSFQYTVCIGVNNCASETIRINVNPISPGNLVADLVSTEQNQSVEIDFFLNDTNTPTQGTVTFSIPENGTVEILNNSTPNDPSDDLVIYTPNTDYFGEDSFQYTVCIGINNCASENITVMVTPISPVNFDLANMPYATLSEYNFFENDISNQEPVYGVVEYEPITPLFTDYAHKKRFVWMPEGVSASYVEDYEILDFPVGTILIKNFYYDNVQPTNTTRIIETRLMIKFASGWDFANYVWNDEQTEANFTNSGSVTNVDWIENGLAKNASYRVPSRSECLTCHKIGADKSPIGVKPQSLNKLFNYDEGELNQLEKLIQMGYLENTLPANIETVVNWKDTSKSLNLRVRSYLDINCAHCHSDLRHCDYRPMRFAFNESSNPINLGECVEPDTALAGLTQIVKPNNTEESVLFFRMNTTQEEYRMPLLGRTLIHEEAVLLVEEWINSLNTECE